MALPLNVLAAWIRQRHKLFTVRFSVLTRRAGALYWIGNREHRLSRDYAIVVDKDSATRLARFGLRARGIFDRHQRLLFL